MATTQAEIRGWLERGSKEGATHMIVVLDTFDYEDYPVYVMPGEDVREIESKYQGPNMQRVMEVYKLSLSWEMQLNEWRAFHY